MHVIFRSDPAELARGGGLSRTSIDMYGLHFQMGVAVDVSHLSEAQKRKLAGNGHFEVVDAPAETQGQGGAESAAAEDAQEAAETAAHVQRAQARKRNKG